MRRRSILLVTRARAHMGPCMGLAAIPRALEGRANPWAKHSRMIAISRPISCCLRTVFAVFCSAPEYQVPQRPVISDADTTSQRHLCADSRRTVIMSMRQQAILSACQGCRGRIRVVYAPLGRRHRSVPQDRATSRTMAAKTMCVHCGKFVVGRTACRMRSE